MGVGMEGSRTPRDCSDSSYHSHQKHKSSTCVSWFLLSCKTVFELLT